MNWRGFLVSAALIFASAPALAKTHELHDFLADTTWCFLDMDTERTHGRIHLNRDGTGKFDLTDAPGKGAIALQWRTWENADRSAVILHYSKGMKPAKQLADVFVTDDDNMVWTWTSVDGTVSFVQRCAPN
jgi:hypothetical protein